MSWENLLTNFCRAQISDQNDKWVNCDCVVIVAVQGPYPGPTDSEQKAIIASVAGLKPITDASYSSDPLDVDPFCPKLGWGAPQRDDDATNGQTSVTSAMNQWCGSIDGKSVSENSPNDLLYQHWPISYYDFWLSAGYWSKSTDSSCGATRSISKDECIDTLTSAMDFCDPDSGTTHGASLTGKCIQYASPALSKITRAPH